MMFTGFILAQTRDTTGRQDTSHTLRAPIENNDSSKGLINSPNVDSLSKAKSDSLKINSVCRKPLKDNSWGAVAAGYPHKNFIRLAFDENKFFGFSSLPVVMNSDIKEFEGKELLFYTLLGILLFFAFIRLSFPKYLGDLFRVTFRTTLKQRQISEQLIQTPIPSLLLNFFFLISASLYLNFVFEHYHYASRYNFWLLFFYCFIGLAFIYIIKFLSLKLSGWLFNISATTDAYTFIVFMINKIMGVFLLPFLVLLAFTDETVYKVAFVLSYIGVFALLAYRFILSYGLIRNQMRGNPFHFFLYLCAFEIVPLFLIYKGLISWF